MRRRGTLGFAASGVGTGGNFGATAEAGEPNPDGIMGGASVWVTWQPQFNGLATFTTAGSGFDTLLAVYTGTTLGALTPVAADDDSAGFLNATVTFAVSAGTSYTIQVDGFYGATGSIVLGWSSQVLTTAPPVILAQPAARTVAAVGSPVTLTVIVQASAATTYQWYLNGTAVDRAISTTLAIASAAITDIGSYQLQITDPQSQVTLLSSPAVVQINVASSGPATSGVFAEDKFRFETDTNNVPAPAKSGGSHSGGAAPASGFTGTQIFSTYGATKDPGEPNPCGEAGGASYWFSYQPPSAGMLTVATIGSSFANVIGVYTGPGDSFATLVPVTCEDTNKVSGGEVVGLSATGGTTYYIVVDGIGGVTGTVNLTYNLYAAAAITNAPVSQTVASGASPTLTVGAAGTPGLSYQWRLNGQAISGATLSSLNRADFQSANEGSYTVVVTNAYGSVTSSVALLYLNAPLRFTNSVISGGHFSALLLGSAHTNYVIESSTALGSWTPRQTNSSAVGIISFTDTNSVLPNNRFYRAYKP